MKLSRRLILNSFFLTFFFLKCVIFLNQRSYKKVECYIFEHCGQTLACYIIFYYTGKYVNMNIIENVGIPSRWCNR
jgi:hypothetical protein